MLLIVFTCSMFVSAALLFLVEPMLAKMVLPMLGGTPAVWNTCLVFFQAVLLCGYLYAHASSKWLGRRTQIVLHFSLTLMALVVLPLRIPAGWEPPAQSSPVPWILGMLSLAVGLPFFLISSSTPMLQRWFAHSGHKSAHDPYFLYAASNAGSLVGLLGYPLLLEPTLRLSEQSRIWTYGYLFFVAMTTVCGILVWRARTAPPSAPAPTEQADGTKSNRWLRRMRWVALAFVPSSLMMGVTTALTTDVPAIPLFWVLPLALYLLSFVMVFTSRPPFSHEWLVQRLPFLILATLYPIVSKTQLPLLLLFPLYLLTLFAVALVCHGELARSRPGIADLTGFYLWISLGGVLGGIFNSLVAPVIFSTVLEFPLALIFAALLRPPIDVNPETPQKSARAKRNDLLLPLALGLCMAALIIGLEHFHVNMSPPIVILLFGYSMVWCMSFGKRPLRFAAGLAALLAASTLYPGPYGRFLHKERNFYGVVRVGNDQSAKYRYLIHGGTLHGSQSLNPARSREPLAYYTNSGPAGSIVHAMQAKTPGAQSSDHSTRWSVVGLGAGAMACYLKPGEALTYYEIDPAVTSIASDTSYFTFLSQCAPAAKIVPGDARLKLRDAEDGSQNLIVLDAFSGDMIPMHLITREALALYIRKLAPGGILAFHITNKFVRLAPTLSALASDAGLVCLMDDDSAVSRVQSEEGKFASQWIVMARSHSDLGTLGTDPHWAPVKASTGTRVWTDDYSNLLHIIKWN